jgi:hypothetical protein
MNAAVPARSGSITQTQFPIAERDDSLVRFQERIYERMDEAKANRRLTSGAFYIVVRAGERRYAIDSALVKTIAEVPDIAPLPSRASGMVGLVQIGGAVYALRDMAVSYAGAKSTSPTYTSRVVCLAPEVDVGVALLVSRIDDSFMEGDIPSDVTVLTRDALRNPGALGA